MTDMPATEARIAAALQAHRCSLRTADGSQIASKTQDTLLALGLLLSPSSQLRPNGSPIGAGEVCLLLWLLLLLGREATSFGHPPTTALSRIPPALARLLAFWAFFAMSLSIGTMTAFLLHDRHDPVWFLHDVMAYPLLAAVSCLSVVEHEAGPRLRRVALLVVTLGSVSLALQLAGAWGVIAFPRSDPWYWSRFRGWSENPAQLAILCAALGLLSLHLAETAVRPGERVRAAACVVLPVVVGWLTRTDTLTIVILTAPLIFVALKFPTWLWRSQPRLPFRGAVAWIAILALPPMVASVVPLAPSIIAKSQFAAKALSKDKGKDAQREAALRFRLWNEAWHRGLGSGMLGLGPGPHLLIPDSIVLGRATEKNAPGNVPHPAANGIPNFEAHNTLFDLFTQGGLLAVLSFVTIVLASLLNAYRAGSAGLTTSLLGLVLLGMSLFIIRHPIFWFVTSLCLVAGGEPTARQTERGRPHTAAAVWHPDRLGYHAGRASMPHRRRPL